jgi:hypothetical protein
VTRLEYINLAFALALERDRAISEASERAWTEYYEKRAALDGEWRRHDPLADPADNRHGH